VVIDFELAAVDIDTADPFDHSWLLDPEKHCREADASVHSSVGPFGLIVLASDNMEEHTAVHFRVYKSQQNYMILMCSDLRRFTYTFCFNVHSFPSLHQLSKKENSFLQVVVETRTVHASLWRLLRIRPREGEEDISENFGELSYGRVLFLPLSLEMNE
jgi:hypothetical protein